MTQAQVDKRRLLEAAQKAAQEAEDYYLHSGQYSPTQKAMNEAKKKLNLDFSLNDNAVPKTPPLPTKKELVRDQTTIVRRRLKCKTFSTTSHTIVSRRRILITNRS